MKQVGHAKDMAELFETLAEPVLVLEPTRSMRLGEDEFFEFCQTNSNLRVERTATGDLVLMAPEGASSNLGVMTLAELFRIWARQDGMGTVFGSSAGFILPNSAMRAPDIAWVRNDRLKTVSDQDFDKFLPLCPDFVLELRSRSDSKRLLQDKMQEYMENGARLGWLLDPFSREVTVYSPGNLPVLLKNPEQISGNLVLPGFVLDVPYLWDVMARRRV